MIFPIDKEYNKIIKYLRKYGSGCILCLKNVFPERSNPSIHHLVKQLMFRDKVKISKKRCACGSIQHNILVYELPKLPKLPKG